MIHHGNESYAVASSEAAAKLEMSRRDLIMRYPLCGNGTDKAA